MTDASLINLGWNEFFEESFARYAAKGWEAGRVASRQAGQYRLIGAAGEYAARLSGKYLHGMESGIVAPVVGDWVAVERKDCTALIHAMLERKSCFSRKPAISGGRKLKRGTLEGGATIEQALAANIDTAFVVAGLDCEINAARIERYFTAAISGGVQPVLLLNKADLRTDTDECIASLQPATKGHPVHAVSAATGLGLCALAGYLAPGRTVAFLGPSGAGKSTLVNRLFGIELQSTQSVNASTGKGRHTTSRADLFVHDSGCMLIDTPGLRELQLWCGEQAVDESFGDVAALVAQCRFSDCRHTSEPGCAVREALLSGALPRARWDNYVKLHSEARHLANRKKQREIMLQRQMKRSTY